MVAFDFSPRDTYNNNYFYDLEISDMEKSHASYEQSERVANEEYLQVASIFEVKKKTATQKELVKAVNVALGSSNTTCEVQVYTGIPSLYSMPTSGTLAASKTVNYTYGGFYTIDLDKPVDLDGSQYFSIVCKVTNPEKKASIYAERSHRSTYDFSYVYQTAGQKWINSKDYTYATIPRIKAYTVNQKRSASIAKNLEFASVEMQENQKRVDYNEQEQNPDFKLQFDGTQLQKDVDYILTYKNNLLPGRATAIYTGIGNYSGTKCVDWTIVKPEQPASIPGVQQSTTSSQRHFTVAANITNYNQIPLPNGWRWTYPNDTIKFDIASNNYVQYDDTENYVRSMWPVTVHRAASATLTTDITTCSINLQQTSYTYTGNAIQPKVT
ncbi:MAG: hypothetical protein K2H85_11980, partial [Allobaculum sp.]|nr:hypothetical protein [Allobaculum sp.]